jgi:TctA family transporter
MAKRGEAARALGAAFSASLIGGLFGALVLTLAVQFARPIILGIGFGEMLMLIILALTMIGMMTGASPLKGLATCALGLLLGSVGTSRATGEYRFAFDTHSLSHGISVVIVGLAMFAIPEIVEILRTRVRISSTQKLGAGTLRGFVETLKHFGLVLRCSSIGTMLGALPGMGGPIITWIAYGHMVQTTKDRDNLGKGDIRGVIAPESANNSDNGGQLIPTLMFGIPGSASMALFLGALIMMGIEPGVGMMTRHLDVTFVIVWSLALANVLGAGICLALAKPIARLTVVPFALLAPFMIGIIYFAAYQVTRVWPDLIALFVLGMLGMYMKRFGWSPPALLIGFVLSPRLEVLLYQSIQVYGYSFLARTGVQIILALIVLSIFVAVRVRPQRRPLSPDGPHAPVGLGPQLCFLAVVAACAVYVTYESFGFTFQGGGFPQSVSQITLALLGALAVGFLRSKKAPSYIFYDSERAMQGEDKPTHSDWHYQAWMLGLLGSIALVGFVLGIFAFITTFLRVKAQVKWPKAALAASGTIVLFGFLSYMLGLDYPEGILQQLVAMPWPFE